MIMTLAKVRPDIAIQWTARYCNWDDLGDNFVDTVRLLQVRARMHHHRSLIRKLLFLVPFDVLSLSYVQSFCSSLGCHILEPPFTIFCHACISTSKKASFGLCFGSDSAVHDIGYSACPGTASIHMQKMAWKGFVWRITLIVICTHETGTKFPINHCLIIWIAYEWGITG